MNQQIFLKHLVISSLILLNTGQADDAAPAQGPLQVISNAAGLLVTEAGQPVLQYQLQVKSRDGKWPRNNYVHPLYDLQGQILTEDFPDDHKHHRGIFWAWHQVLAGDVRMGDAWVCEDFGWDVQSSAAQINNDGSATLSAHVHWQSPALTDDAGRRRSAVSETTTITVHPATQQSRLVDFDIRLRPLVPGVRIGGSDDDKGYGGFSPRISLSDQPNFQAAAGPVDPINTAVSAGPWMNIASADRGLAILCHPDNPGFPQPWILRSRRSMQNAVFPGAVPVVLPADRPLRLRYRLVIHQGTDSPLTFSDMHDDYAREN